MASYQIEAGIAIGRGFADVDPTGFGARFKTWVVKTPAAGGPGWYILIDRSTAADAAPKAITGVDTGTNTITIVGHGFNTGEQVTYTITSGSIGGLTGGNTYYVYKVDDDNLRLSSNIDGTWDTGSPRDLTSYSAGTLTLSLYERYLVVSTVAAPTVNQACHIIKAGYTTAIAGNFRFQSVLSFNTTTKMINGYWSGYTVATVDAGSFAYDFRGGSECLFIHTRLSTTWYRACFDIWIGDANLVEGTDKRGVLIADMSNNHTAQLGSGEAANFTLNKFYYIYDMNGHTWVDYVKITNVNLGLDQISFDRHGDSSFLFNHKTGAVIAAYEHRFWSYGNGTNVIRFNTSTGDADNAIPYYSGYAGYVSAGQNNAIVSGNYLFPLSNILTTLRPDDKGYYAVQRPTICEVWSNSSSSYTNRAYGVVKNVYLTYRGSMVLSQDGRVIGGKNYLYMATNNNVSYGGSSQHAVLLLDTTSLS